MIFYNQKYTLSVALIFFVRVWGCLESPVATIRGEEHPSHAFPSQLPRLAAAAISQHLVELFSVQRS